MKFGKQLGWWVSCEDRVHLADTGGLAGKQGSVSADVCFVHLGRVDSLSSVYSAERPEG